VRKDRGIALALIMVGFLFPILLLPATTGYNRNAGIVANTLGLKVVVWVPKARGAGMSDNSSTVPTTNEQSADTHTSRGRQPGIQVPYRFPLAFSILLVFLGARKFDQSRVNTNRSD
jgi:hypothetical protein